MSKHTPYVRYAERVHLVQPGETVRIELVIRNADECGNPPSNFRLSAGYHPPHDGSAWLKVGRVSMENKDGSDFNRYITLAPGQETTAYVVMEIKEDQPEKGFVTPSVFVIRDPLSGHEWEDWMRDVFDAEGPCVAVGMTPVEARGKAYNPGPSI